MVSACLGGGICIFFKAPAAEHQQRLLCLIPSHKVKCHLLGCSKVLGSRGPKIPVVPLIALSKYFIFFSKNSFLMSWKGNGGPRPVYIKAN